MSRRSKRVRTLAEWLDDHHCEDFPVVQCASCGHIQQSPAVGFCSCGDDEWHSVSEQEVDRELAREQEEEYLARYGDYIDRKLDERWECAGFVDSVNYVRR
jgi:hypothetical protein